MDVYDFAYAMCHLNTAITMYLNAKKAREYCSQGSIPLPNDVINTILDVLSEKMDQYQKEIIELAIKLSDQQEKQPAKKK